MTRNTGHRDRDLSIETLRGLGILLVVILHSVNADAGGAYHYFTFCFDYLTMPLFTAISGYVYAMRPVQPTNMKRFVSSKTRRIILPLLSVATLQYFLSTFISGQSASGWWRIYFVGYGQFWFLESLLLVFLVVAILDVLNTLDSFIVLSLLILLTGLARIVTPELKIDSIDGFIYILPYFLWGVSLKRFPWQLQNPILALSMVFFAAGGTVLQHIAKGGGLEIRLDTNGPLATVTGIALVYIAFRWRRRIPLLDYIGKYSFSIFLFHAFGVSIGERMMGLVYDSDSYLPVFMLKLSGGVVAGILTEKVLSRFSFLQFIFLGIKPLPAQKTHADSSGS
ncbi:MAG: acyltransferase [Deltaproteobacteria bacterium]|nr:acyltransferase [Deltaproteobacteria bacterium]